ncbi:MAG: DNA repair protein RecO [Spirochaetales bacterium]|nr:DNA repair protein RecO [Spirochaetales bacterium]
MSRNSITQAIVLKTYRIGEIHKGVTLLTKNTGIINAIAHGAWKIKSRLRAHTQLFNYVRVYLYYNPVKQSYKITDIESLRLCDMIVKSLKKYYIVSICAEIILKSFGGGESVKEMFFLFLSVLQTLGRICDDEADFILIQFFWRFLLITGHRPDFTHCHHCGTSLPTTSGIYSIKGIPGFVCTSCKHPGAIQLNSGMIKYLENTEQLPITQSLCYKIAKESETILKEVLSAIIETCIETPLQSLKQQFKEYV